MLIDLSLLPVFPQQSPQDSLASHPEQLGGHTSVPGTLAFTEAHVSSLALGLDEHAMPGTRVDDLRLDDDVTVLD